MEIKNQLDLQGLETYYLFANTPGYLYRHFRANSSISELAKHNTSAELIDAFNNLKLAQERSLEDVVTAYALLVALTFLPEQEVLIALAKIDPSYLDWGKQIVNLFETTRKTTNSFQFNNPLVSLEFPHQGAKIGNLSIDIKIPPKVVGPQPTTAATSISLSIPDTSKDEHCND